MKSIVTVLVVFAGLTQASATTLYNCKATSVEPKNANFFVRGGRVEVGDELVFDPLVKEIDRLQFKSGRGLPFFRHDAKLTAEPSEVGNFKLKGSKQGTLGLYRGVLQGYITPEQGGSFTLQALREDMDIFTLHSATFECKPL